MKRALGHLALAALASLPLFAATTQSASATEVGGSRPLGLGFALGDPTAIVGKLYGNGRSNALDFGLSFAQYGWRRCWWHAGVRYCDRSYGALGVHADYLWQYNLASQGNVVLDWHIGAGGRAWFYYADRADGRDALALAGRMPVGLDLMFRNPSFLEVFLEVAPTLYIIPEVWLGFPASLGVRFYF